MKIRTAFLLTPVLLALCIGTAVAKTPPRQGARLDPSFGRAGVAKTATALPLQSVGMAVAPGGKTYLVQGSTVLAFDANGRPNRQFGGKGRVTVAALDGVPATGIAVSEGRVFVIATFNRPNPEGVVISLLPDGAPNQAFGLGGEVRLPVPAGAASTPQPPYVGVEPASILIDAQGRPVIGGGVVTPVEFCGLGYTNHPVPFVARLTPSGRPDTTFGGGSYAILGGGGRVDALAPAPGGELATLENRHFECNERGYFGANTTAGRVTEAGAPSPALDPSRPALTVQPLLGVDSSGRSIVSEVDEFLEDDGTLDRLLPSGGLDPSFGNGGRVALTSLLGQEAGPPDGVAVDSHGRPLVAAGSTVLRLRRDGSPDPRFGPRGIVEARTKEGACEATMPMAGAIGLDRRGRIYVACAVKSKSLKTGHGVQVIRLLPGS